MRIHARTEFPSNKDAGEKMWRTELDRGSAATEGDEIMLAQRLAAQLGLAVGISSGANFLGSLQVQEDLGPDATVATIFCDSNKKYLSTDLLCDEPVRPGYLSPEIELLGIESER